MTDLLFTTPQLVWIAVLIFSAALIKTGFGIGAGVFLSATLCLFVSPKTAIAMGGPVMLLTDFSPMIRHRRAIRWNVLLVLLAGSLCGTVLGGFVMDVLPDRWFARAVGLVCAVFAGWQLFRAVRNGPAEADGREEPPAPLRTGTGLFIGFLGGIATVIAHAGGLLYALWLMRLRLEKGAFVGTVVALFFLTDILKIVTYWKLQLLTPPVLLVLLWMVPALAAGSIVGHYLHEKVSARVFVHIIVGGVFVLSIRLMFFS